jgi:hypothetical protein
MKETPKYRMRKATVRCPKRGCYDGPLEERSKTWDDNHTPASQAALKRRLVEKLIRHLVTDRSHRSLDLCWRMAEKIVADVQIEYFVLPKGARYDGWIPE